MTDPFRDAEREIETVIRANLAAPVVALPLYWVVHDYEDALALAGETQDGTAAQEVLAIFVPLRIGPTRKGFARLMTPGRPEPLGEARIARGTHATTAGEGGVRS